MPICKRRHKIDLSSLAIAAIGDSQAVEEVPLLPIMSTLKKKGSDGPIRGFESEPTGMSMRQMWRDPITRYRWVMLAWASLAGDGWTYEAGVSASIIQLPAYVAHLGYGETQFIPDNIAQWIGPIYTLGQLFGGLIAAFFCDRFGRKPVLWSGSLMVIISTSLMIISPNVAVVLIARIFQGLSIGFLLLGYQIYAVEMAGPQDRGFISTFSLISGNVVGVIAACVVYGVTYVTGNWGWRLALGISYIPAVALFIALHFLPESPRYLYQKGKAEEASRVIGKFHGFANGTRKDDTYVLGPAAQIEYDAMIAAIKEDHDRGYDKWKSLWNTSSARYRLFMSLSSQFFWAWNGSSVLTYYYVQVFDAAGITDSHLAFGIASLQNVSWILSGIVGGISLDMLGRRFNYVFGLGQMGVCLAIQGGLAIRYFDGLAPDVSPNKVAGAIWVTLYMVQWFLWVAFFSSAVNLLPAELWPTGLRARGFALSNVVSMSVSFSYNYKLEPDVARVGFGTQYSALPMYRKLNGWTWIVFAGIMFLSTAVVWLFYVEPKGLALEEIEALFGSTSTGNAVLEVTGRDVTQNLAPYQRFQLRRRGRIGVLTRDQLEGHEDVSDKDIGEL